MTRKELLRALSDLGHRINPTSIEHAIVTGKVATPPIDSSGRRIYSQEHVDGLIAYHEAVQARRKQPA